MILVPDKETADRKGIVLLPVFSHGRESLLVYITPWRAIDGKTEHVSRFIP